MMIRSILISTLFFIGTLSVFSQSPPAPEVQAAFAKVGAGQAEEAIAEMQAYLKANPDHFGAYSVLGFGYRSTGDHAASANAFAKAQQLQPKRGTTMFNLGVSLAMDKRVDEAFEWLMKARDAGNVNITNVGNSPAAAILQADSRYRELFPSEAEYAYPFSEKDITIIHDLKGEHAGDQFGWVARTIGDVDGDKAFDFVTSAPTNNEGSTAAGKIYVYSGRTGKLIWSKTGSVASGQLGMCAEEGGDVNADGVPDVVAGAPFANQVNVYDGRNGDLLFAISGPDSAGAFGRDALGVGDVNGDGHGDILIGEPFQIWGAPLTPEGAQKAGRVWLYSGKDGQPLFHWEGDSAGDGFGTALGGQTHDGKTLLMMGSPNSGTNNAGQIYVYQGMQKKPFTIMRSDSTGAALGAMFMSVCGDVDADGTSDLYASDFSNSANGPSTGRAYVYSGATGLPLLTFTGENPGDGFGIGVADAGDVNQDGHADLVIGAWQYAAAAPSGGKIYVYSGQDGKLLQQHTGNVVGETLGFDATGLGDVNGDGGVDLLLTSAWSAINGVRSGRVIIVAGKRK